MEVEVLWDTGEKSWEPLNVMKTDDPVTVAQYVKEKNLQDQHIGNGLTGMSKTQRNSSGITDRYV